MTTLETLLAKDEIRDLVLSYCRAIDRRDYAALKDLYHPDAIDDHGGMFKGGVGDFLDWLPSMLETMKATSHMVTNHLIVVDGDEAEGEVVTTAYHLTTDEAGNDIEVVIGGRYLDRYQRRDGRWRFSHRKIVLDWNQIQPSLSQMESPIVAGTPVGGRTDRDPSADFFRLITFSDQ